MSVIRMALLCGATFGFCAVSVVCGAQAPTQTPKLVRQVDHILISSSRAKELFSLLSETFAFPIAWPMSSYGSFASGGVAIGNVNLEVLKSSESADAASGKFTGFALEPEPLRASLRELAARRIPHGKPIPFRSRQANGSSATLWTTVGLPSVSSDGIEVFFCEYGHDVPARRDRLREQLRSCNGGPLSVHSVREIVCGARDLKRMEELWQTLLNPLQASSDGAWQIGDGPALRLVKADRDEIQGLILNVTSLEQARRFLKEHGLLGTDEPAALTLAGPHLQGLSITLVAQHSEKP
jgi:hypothetical protein